MPRFGALTLVGVVEMVVILRDVGHDAEAVGDLHGDHVTGIQQGRDPQLLLSHLKGLQRQQRADNQEAEADSEKEAGMYHWWNKTRAEVAK